MRGRSASPDRPEQLLHDRQHGGSAAVDQVLTIDLEHADVGQDPVVEDIPGGRQDLRIVQRPAVIP
jgi:hypothetical protein